jgi:uncharacterized protein YjbI with pentapeptide repeats
VGGCRGEYEHVERLKRGVAEWNAWRKDALLFAEVNLTGANLTDTVLDVARLTGANLGGAKLDYTVFGNVDLTGVIGLEIREHVGPSTVDYRTIQNSGSLPLAFLRGVGSPDSLIEYLPSLLNQAIQYYSCFISYSSKDQDFADRIQADLQSNGVRCWFAPHDLPIGCKILDGVDAAIPAAGQGNADPVGAFNRKLLGGDRSHDSF